MIDDEIRDALKVDPSPELLARVRTRVANEPAPSRWRWSWTVAAAGAMAAAVMIAGVIPRPQKITPAVPQARILLVPEPAVPGTTAVPAPGRSAEAVAVPSPASAAARRPTAAQPEILLDPAETRALRGLIAGVRAGRVDLAAVQNSVTPEPMALPPITDIEIPPITIEPLAPLSGAEGVRP